MYLPPRRRLAVGLVTLGIGVSVLMVTWGTTSSAMLGVAASGAGSGSAAPAPAALDPLSQDEIHKAQQLATSATAAKLPASRSVTGRGGPQLLFADRRDDKADLQRRADVYLYDYASERGVHVVVNLTTSRIERFSSMPGLQPPPAPEETRRAVQVLLAHQRHGATLKAMYRAATGTDLTAPEQLWAQGFAFDARRATGVAGHERAPQCGPHRCVQLVIRIPGGKWVNTSRVVVDLSSQRVIVLR